MCLRGVADTCQYLGISTTYRYARFVKEFKPFTSTSPLARRADKHLVRSRVEQSTPFGAVCDSMPMMIEGMTRFLHWRLRVVL